MSIAAERRADTPADPPVDGAAAPDRRAVAALA